MGIKTTMLGFSFNISFLIVMTFYISPEKDIACPRFL
jgi:hypothetical protein